MVPVAGWWEGSWRVTGDGLHLAVLWLQHGREHRIVVLTQDPGALVDRIERIPIPLSEKGALTWLAGGGLEDQVRQLTVVNQTPDGPRQLSLFDND